jgi:hypothetical protein
MKSVLKVVSGGMKTVSPHWFAHTQQQKVSHPAVLDTRPRVLTKDAILALPQASFLSDGDCLTAEFLATEEQIDHVLGTTLTTTTLQRLLCCQRPIKWICTFTNAAMY